MVFDRSSLLLVLALAAPCALVSSASAEPSAASKETARHLLDEGDKKASAGDLQGALKDYKAADEIMGVPTTGIEVARTQVKLGLLVEARDTLQRLLRTPAQPKEPAAFVNARTAASRLNDELDSRIPSVKVTVDGLAAGVTAEVSVDGEAIPAAVLGLPRKLNPGTRRIVASARGYKSVTLDIKLAEKEARDIPVRLEPIPADTAPPASAPSVSAPPASAPATPPPTTPPTTAPPTTAPPTTAPPTAEAPSPSMRKPVLIYGGFGLGALGIVAGSVGGFIAMSKASDAKDLCTGNRCKPQAYDSIVSAKNWALVSNIGFGVGAAGAGIGLVAMIALSGTSTAARLPVTPVVGLDQLGVRGQF